MIRFLHETKRMQRFGRSLSKIGILGCCVCPSIVLAEAVPGVSRAPQIKGQPAIHITREWDSPHVRKVKQAGYELCLLNRENLIKYKNKAVTGNEVDRALWEQTKKSMQRDQPNYVVGKPLAKAPDWDKMAVKREEEYFFKEKHAIYRYRDEYKLIDDGSCGYKRKTFASADIDDGKTRYVLDLVRKTGRSMQSRVTGIQMSRKELRAFAKEHPEFGRDMANKLFKLNGDGPWSSLSKINNMYDFLGTENIASRQCDRYALKGSKRTEICLWNQMYVYPGVVERPVVLMTRLHGKKLTTEKKAIQFVLSESMDESVFQVPPGFTLDKRRTKGNSSP